MMRPTVLFLAWLIGIAAVLAPQPGRAADLPAALAGFAEDSFGATADAVNRVTASGDPRAAAIIEALAEGRLLVSKADGRVFVRDQAGALVDAATGAGIAGEDPPGLRKVRLNNAVRGAITATLGMLRLQSGDPQARRKAADAVFASRDPAALPALDAALARETDPRVTTALREARAAIVIAAADAVDADRLDAIAVLEGRGDDEAKGILAAVPADSPDAVRNAAAVAIAAIERRLAVWNAAQNAWYGLSLGSVLLLAAIGLAITFGVMGVINMAHGEMVMLGAYTTFVVQEAFRAHLPGAVDYALAVAIPAAFVVSGAVGIAIERGIIRYLYGRPLETLLATWGLSLILQRVVRDIFGPSNRDVGNPSWMEGAFSLGQLSITYSRLWILVFSLAVLLALAAVIRWTVFGLYMRAVTQNRRMAGSMGIRSGTIDALTFGLGSGIAGMAGVALSQIDNVGPNLGQGYIIDSFMVVVFGGVGNLWGTLVGAFSLGVVNKFLEPYAGAVLGKILVLVAIILFIQKRPRGLFALRGRAVEA